MPQFKTKVKLTEAQEKKIVDEIVAELDAIEKEREADKLEAKWEALDNQYDGEMQQVEGAQFNLHKHTTKIKVDSVTRAITQAFFEGDKIFSVGARPGYEKTQGHDVLDMQEDFLDYKCDEIIPLKQVLPLVAHSATLKGTGVLKVTYQITSRKRKREEVYQGSPHMIPDERTGRPQMGQDGSPIIQNEGLEGFLKQYPEAVEKYPQYVKKLMLGKKITLVVEYDEIVYHDPMPKYVDLKNFFVRSNVKKLVGLRDAYLMAEKKTYTYWELKQEEREENLYNVDELTMTKDEKGENKRIDKFANQNYDLYEVVMHTKLDAPEEGEQDTSEFERLVFHFSKDKKKIVGAYYYPYYGVDTYYLPFYIKNKKDGFYDEGIGEDLTDANIAQNAILNFALEGAWISNMVTPIVPPGSDIETQFLEKKWMHGLPLSAKSGEVDFLSKYMRPSNTPELIQLIQYLVQDSDDVSGVSSLMTGRESPTDPTAPAAKTLALLERSGLNVKDYIRCFLPSFNEVANVFLQMYYQMNADGVKYRLKPEMVVGNNPFGVMSREDMVAKTAIQSQAFTFNFEKANEKREDLALLQILRQEPIFAGNPDAVYYTLKDIVKNWSPKWRANVEKIFPDPTQFKQAQMMMAVQAVGIFVQESIKNAKVTGQELEFDPRQLMASIQQMLKEMVTPPTKEEVEAREDAANGQV
jgi:hypothetical protein